MYLEQLDIHDVRNLSGLHMECSPGINVITGRNGAGKTAILEAIHLLARTSSFRTPRVNEVIQHGKQSLVVSAQLSGERGNKVNTGLEKSREKTRIRFNGSNISKRSEQALNIPLITISPESHQLLSGSPQSRRHWLDWAMFHVEPDYIKYWQDFYYALRQRNALLRRSAPPEQFKGWDEALARAGTQLRQKRDAYLCSLNQQYRETTGNSGEMASLRLRSKEQGTEEVVALLRQNLRSDIESGHTQAGAHREDVVFGINGHEAGRVLSRGQAKLLVLHLFISQALVFHERRQQWPMLLIDDLCAELDVEARGRMLEQLKLQRLQIFITTTEPGRLADSGAVQRWFHVEQGRIAAIT